MIIEVHLTPDESLAHAKHLKVCGDHSCEHVAHLCDSANVFVFVNRSEHSHLRRLQRARMHEMRESRRARQREQQAVGLAAIRRAWDRMGL